MTQDTSRIAVLKEGRFIRFLRNGTWEYAERVNRAIGVVIIAVTPGGRLLLVEQYRAPVQAPVIELPAGLAGDIQGRENESLADAARRELTEETGWKAARFTELARGPISPGLTNEIVAYLRAEGLTRVGDGGGDEHEDIRVHEVPLHGIEDWLRAQEERGRMVDPKVWVGILDARQRST